MGIPPAPRGVPQTGVTSDNYVNRSLNVSARDKSTGRSNQTTITSEEGRFSRTDTDHIGQEAEEYRDDAKEDEKFHEQFVKCILHGRFHDC